MADLELIQEVLVIIIVCMFAIGLLISLVVLGWVVITVKGWTITKCLQLMIPIGLAARLTDMCINHQDYLTRDIRDQTCSSIVLGSFPGYILFSEYLLLVIFWIILLYRAHDKEINNWNLIKLIYIIANIVIYTIYAGLMISMCLVPENIRDNYLHPLEGMVTGSGSLMIALFFLIFGTKTLIKLKKNPPINSHGLLVARKVFFLTIICTILFTLRSVDVILSLFVLNSPVPDLISSTIFLIGLEWLPTMLILFVLTWPRLLICSFGVASKQELFKSESIFAHSNEKYDNGENIDDIYIYEDETQSFASESVI